MDDVIMVKESHFKRPGGGYLYDLEELVHHFLQRSFFVEYLKALPPIIPVL
jgi:hypothetical protein